MLPLLLAFATVPEGVVIDVRPGARQTFGGFGASLLNFGGEYQTLTSAQRQTLSGALWGDLRFRTLRLWFNVDRFAPSPGVRDLTEFRRCYVRSGIIRDARRNGVTTLLLAPDHAPEGMVERNGDGRRLKEEATEAFADLVAEAIDRLRREDGVRIDVTGVRNEPNDTVRMSPGQIVRAVKRLRRELDRRGLKRVGIVAPENASADGVLLEQVEALRKDPEAWSALRGVASHSYNMGANDIIARLVRGSGKAYWMTEASDNGAEAPGDALRAASLASRFLGDVNHGVTDWIHFVGFEVADPNDDATRIMRYTPKPFAVTRFAKYGVYRMLARAFDVGATFRGCESGLDGSMAYTYGKKPRVSVATARNPDGTWAFGVSNYTAASFSDRDDEGDFALHNSGRAARTFDVTLRAPEIRGTVRFRVVRSDGATSVATMRDGTLVLPAVGPLAVVTLRSMR